MAIRSLQIIGGCEYLDIPYRRMGLTESSSTRWRAVLGPSDVADAVVVATVDAGH
jgi:hypothetical protein